MASEYSVILEGPQTPAMLQAVVKRHLGSFFTVNWFKWNDDRIEIIEQGPPMKRLIRIPVCKDKDKETFYGTFEYETLGVPIQQINRQGSDLPM